MTLYRTTLTIWTQYDPAGVDLADLGHDADQGEALASQWTHDPVPEQEVPVAIRSFFSLEALDDD